jgi:hypothetical protein
MCLKAAAYWVRVNYRETYDLFIAYGSLFNHESQSNLCGECYNAPGLVIQQKHRAVFQAELNRHPNGYLIVTTE